MRSPTGHGTSPLNPLPLIRVAMLLGVLIFGGVTWYIRRSGAELTFDPNARATLLWVGRGTWVLAMLTCLTLYGISRNARTEERRRAVSLIGWAAGESVALFGGVVWFLTNNPEWYIAGLIFLVMTFLAFPVRRE